MLDKIEEKIHGVDESKQDALPFVYRFYSFRQNRDAEQDEDKDQNRELKQEVTLWNRNPAGQNTDRRPHDKQQVHHIGPQDITDRQFPMAIPDCHQSRGHFRYACPEGNQCR